MMSTSFALFSVNLKRSVDFLKLVELSDGRRFNSSTDDFAHDEHNSQRQ